MTEENSQAISPGAKSPIVLRPWLAALVALGLYGLTLNHWVTFASLPFAAQITGWNWHPGPLPWRPSSQYPLFFLVTFPLRLLPADWRVLGWNVFNAACAALTLAILARSVRLFSHDRTKEQRLREGGEYALLSVRAAFLPAAFAVLLLAAQLTFWQNAVSGTVEMMDLLVFAFLILCLLEYRISQSEWRLNLFALVYGLGVANNWALVGFFPCFFLALVWIKRMGFFNWRFALRMAGWGALGLLLYGLMPLWGALHHDGTFWELLHQKLAEQHIYLFRLRRYYAFFSGATTLVPLFFAAINWPSFEGELSGGAHDLSRVMFRVLHIVFLFVGALMFFDVKLSPSPRNLGIGVMGGPSFLTFYYLAALSVGYFSGYVLLVFGKDVEYRWGQATGLLRLLNRVVTGLLWVAAIALPAMLFYENYPHIRDFNNPAVAQFGNEMAKALPAKPAIVLADDPARLYLAMGARQRLGLPDQYTFIESRSLIHREYLRYLADQYPSFRKVLTNNLDSLPDVISSRLIGDLLAHLSRRQPVFYLHPSFGSYFEHVFMTPHRLGVELHPIPTNALDTFGLSPAELAANQAYWHALEKQSLASLPELAKSSPDAMLVADYYSQILDYWGTELQKAATELKLLPPSKASLLHDANDQFAEALRLNPDNLVARLNQQYNAYLRGASPAGRPFNSSDLAAGVTSWEYVYNVDGPADVPDLDLVIGRDFATNGAYLQAAHLFQRSIELATNDLEVVLAAELDLAKTYIDMGLVDAGLGLIRDIHQRASVNSLGLARVNPLDLVRVEALAYAQKTNFTQADQLLTEARGKNPKDVGFAAVMADFYRLIGYFVLHEGNGDAAKEKEAAIWFRKSLAALEDQLQLLNAPINVIAKAREVPIVNLQKAEMQMMLKDYEAAIITLTPLIRQDPENPVPLLNRAISELQFGRLEPAKNDYQALEKIVPQPSHMVYYGLAQIAQKQNDKPAEIRYDKLYLQCAPRNTAEFTNVTRQLQKLEGH